MRKRIGKRGSEEGRGRRVQLHRALSKLGLGSRTQAWDWIRAGEVRVDGRVVTDPLTLQHPRPPIMSAAVSGAGRQFATQSADILFTVLPDLERAPKVIEGVQQDAAAHGRRTDVYIQTQIVCRPTRKDAEDFYYYFAEEHAHIGARLEIDVATFADAPQDPAGPRNGPTAAVASRTAILT